MRRSVHMTLAILLTAVFVALPSVAYAIDIRQGATVTIDSGETVEDDIYAVGALVEIDGQVEGDVVAFAQSVFVSGDVSGDVIVAGQTIRISGDVDGSVRAAGMEVTVDGDVTGDVLAGAAWVLTRADTVVGRDMAIGAGQATIRGEIGRDIYAGTGTLYIDADVGGDIEAETEELTIADDAVVGGDVDYWSATGADVRGEVAGSTTRHEPRVDAAEAQQNEDAGILAGVFAFFFAVFTWVRGLIGMILFGLIVVLLFRGWSVKSAQTATEQPWVALAIGLGVLFGVPVVAIIILIAGALVGGWWIGLMLLALYAIALTVAIVLGALTLGRLLLRSRSETHDVWAMILGLALIWIASVIPFIGWLAVPVAMLLGLGAGVLAVMDETGSGHTMAPPASVPPSVPSTAPPAGERTE